VVDYRTHEHPVWRERADALIHLPFTFDGKEYVEQLWTRHETDDLFEVCCIPAYAYNLALGDIVEAPGYVVSRVLRRSGRFTFRVRFGADAMRHWKTTLPTLRQGRASRSCDQPGGDRLLVPPIQVVSEPPVEAADYRRTSATIEAYPARSTVASDA
jgi:hypothetical protein